MRNGRVEEIRKCFLTQPRRTHNELADFLDPKRNPPCNTLLMPVKYLVENRKHYYLGFMEILLSLQSAFNFARFFQP